MLDTKPYLKLYNMLTKTETHPITSHLYHLYPYRLLLKCLVYYYILHSSITLYTILYVICVTKAKNHLDRYSFHAIEFFFQPRTKINLA